LTFSNTRKEFAKLDVHDRTAAVAKVIRRGIIRIQ
jgi:DNA-binding NarL/FixJ family response regulator